MKIIGNLKDLTWTNDLKANPENIPYSIGFKIPGQKNIVFQDLSFNISISKDGEEVFSKTYPEPGQKFISSSQSYLVSDLVEEIKPLTEYSVAISANHNGQNFSDSFIVKTPEPFKPFPSWTYDPELGDFVPPVPYPEDGRDHEWSESSQAWIVLE